LPERNTSAREIDNLVIERERERGEIKERRSNETFMKVIAAKLQN